MAALLVTGEMRSGTTFVANLLNSQANMSIYSDTLISLFSVSKYLKIYDVSVKLTETQKNLIVSNLNAEGSALGIDFDILRSYNSWMELFNKCIELLEESNDKSDLTYVGIKKTNESHYLKPLLDNDVKIIYVIRDPRDVMLSNKNRHIDHNIFSFANRLKKNLNAARELEEHKNMFILKYHELINDKDTVKQYLEDFLEMKLNFSLQELTMRNDTKYKQNSSFGDVRKLFDPSALDRWKSNKEEEDVLFANAFFQNELKWMGLNSCKSLNQNRTKTLLKAYKSSMRKDKLKGYLKRLIH